MEWRHVDELLFCRHPFTAEDQLVSKWCDAKFFYAAKLIYILDDLRLRNISANFHYSFKIQPAKFEHSVYYYFLNKYLMKKIPLCKY